MIKKRLLGILLGFMLTIGMMMAFGISLPAYADNAVTYLDENGAEKTCDEYTKVTYYTDTFANNGWYVVSDSVNRAANYTVEDNSTAYLILCDNTTLTVGTGITVNSGSTLYIFAQSTGDNAGKINATGGTNHAGIGGEYGKASGNIIINGGDITATSDRGAGIGGGRFQAGGNTTINGGRVTATSTSEGAGIGGAEEGDGGTVVINGGTVTATGGMHLAGGSTYESGAGIGGGHKGSGASVTINGGTVKATGGYKAQGIGSGSNGTSTIPGSLNIGEAVKLETSSDDTNWSDTSSETNTRTQYMRTSEINYTVDISGGTNSTPSGGGTSQTVRKGQNMTAVTYTVNSGYLFEAFEDILDSGITASLGQNGEVTVSGTPTADVSITIPDAVPELVVAKKVAKKSLDDLLASKVESDYDSEDWITLTQAIADGKAAIDSATTVNLVNEARNYATNVANSIKTKDQKAIPTPTNPTAVGTIHSVGGSNYIVTSASTVSLIKAPSKKSFTLPAEVGINGNTFSVTGIYANAFRGTKVKTLTVKTKMLTKASVKGSIKGSKVKKVKVKVGKKKENKLFVKRYKKYFTKKNCGKKVRVTR